MATTPNNIEKRMKRNRQANFYIMRHLWSIIGRGKKEAGSINEAFEMARTRYERFIEGDITRWKEGELERLQKITGIRIEIFDGRERYKLRGMKSKDWINFFLVYGWNPSDLTDEEDEEYKAGRKDGKDDESSDPKNKIKTAIMVEDRDNIKNPDFYRLCRFIYSKKSPEALTEMTIQEFISRLDSYTIKKLSEVPTNVLEAYIKSMEEQIKKASAVIMYKQEEEIEKDNPNKV